MTTTGKLYILNFAGLCLVAWAWWLGFVARLTEADAAHMAYVIAAVFLAGVASTFWQARKVDHYYDSTSIHTVESIHLDTAHLYDVFASLFILGIIGNALGFLIAFGGVDIAALTDPEGVRKAGAQLLSGAGTAFGSTLVGLTLALWTSVNLRTLATATERLNNG